MKFKQFWHGHRTIFAKNDPRPKGATEPPGGIDLDTSAACPQKGAASREAMRRSHTHPPWQSTDIGLVNG